MLNTKITNNKNRLLLKIDENEIKQNIFTTFKIDQVELDNTEIIRNIKIYVCSVSWHEIIKIKKNLSYTNIFDFKIFIS